MTGWIYPLAKKQSEGQRFFPLGSLALHV